MASPSKQLDGEMPHRECKYRMIYREMIYQKEKGSTQSFIAKTTDGVCTERSSNNSWNYNGNKQTCTTTILLLSLLYNINLKYTAMTNEVWKGMNEFKGFYEVSSNGRVRSIDRLVIRSNGRPINIKGKEIRIGKDKDGYSIVRLYIKGRAYIRKVHRLVYEAFNGELVKDLVVDHIDNDKTNNTKGNLQQITGRLNVSKDRKRSLPTGVYKNMHGNGYKVQFQADNTSIYVGTFGSIKEADDIYKKSLSNYKKTGHLPTPVVQRNTINEGKKVCPMCGVEKSVDSFYWANKKKGLRHSKCKECLKKYKEQS